VLFTELVPLQASKATLNTTRPINLILNMRYVSETNMNCDDDGGSVFGVYWFLLCKSMNNIEE
jgi:hypothetical protein